MTKDLIINNEELTSYNLTKDLLINIHEPPTKNKNKCLKNVTNPYFSIMFFIVFIILLMVVYGLLSYHRFIIFND
jgi:hypothetical protein